MIVLSLFNGISIGQLALEMEGIKVDKYFASETDKYANQVTMKHFPETIQLGDVTKIDVSTLPKIDLLLGGSPCQGFSSAGKGLNFDDPRSALFFEFVRIKNELTERNPDLLFLLENVKMISEWENVISEHVGIYPVEINSALVSAQQRKRLYWTNIKTRTFGMFGHLVSDIPQPADRGIYLQDILKNRTRGIKLVPWKMKMLRDAARKYGGDLILDSRKNTTVHILTFNSKSHSQRVYLSTGKALSLTTSEDYYFDGKYLFRLLMEERENLQTLPPEFTKGISKSWRVKCTGNCWTAAAIAHILSYMEDKWLK